MYHKIEDQEKHPENYVLANVDLGTVEDECFDLISKPRQTQRTIGLYLKKTKVAESQKDTENAGEPQESWEEKRKSFVLTTGDHRLERLVKRNKGFWVGKPQVSAPLMNKLKDRYSVEIPKKAKRGQGIFSRPGFLELDYVIKLANAGLLYSDEEFSDSEEEIEPDTTSCLPLRKERYKICDPCKEKRQKKEKPPEGPPKDLIEEMQRSGKKPPFKKIPTGCQCDYFGEHNIEPTAWDNPFEDRVDMLRQHEMNKVTKPYKCELFNKNYEKRPPVKFMPYEFGRKRTFPVFQISNL